MWVAPSRVLPLTGDGHRPAGQAVSARTSSTSTRRGQAADTRPETPSPTQSPRAIVGQGSDSTPCSPASKPPSPPGPAGPWSPRATGKGNRSQQPHGPGCTLHPPRRGHLPLFPGDALPPGQVLSHKMHRWPSLEGSLPFKQREPLGGDNQADRRTAMALKGISSLELQPTKVDGAYVPKPPMSMPLQWTSKQDPVPPNITAKMSRIKPKNQKITT